MTKKTTFRAIYKGQVFTRTSTHAYAFMVGATDERGVGTLGWTTRRDLADKLVSRWSRDAGLRDIEIIPVY